MRARLINIDNKSLKFIFNNEYIPMEDHHSCIYFLEYSELILFQSNTSDHIRPNFHTPKKSVGLYILLPIIIAEKPQKGAVLTLENIGLIPRPTVL